MGFFMTPYVARDSESSMKSWILEKLKVQNLMAVCGLMASFYFSLPIVCHNPIKSMFERIVGF